MGREVLQGRAEAGGNRRRKAGGRAGGVGCGRASHLGPRSPARPSRCLGGAAESALAALAFPAPTRNPSRRARVRCGGAASGRLPSVSGRPRPLRRGRPRPSLLPGGRRRAGRAALPGAPQRPPRPAPRSASAPPGGTCLEPGVVVVDSPRTGDAAPPAAPGGRVTRGGAVQTRHLRSATCRRAALLRAAAGSARTGRCPPAPTPSSSSGAAPRPPVTRSLGGRCSARPGEGLRLGRRGFRWGSWASRRKPCGRGSFEHLRGHRAPGAACRVWTTTPSSSGVQEKGRLSEETFLGGARAALRGPAGGGRAPPAGRRGEGGSRAGVPEPERWGRNRPGRSGLWMVNAGERLPL